MLWNKQELTKIFREITKYIVKKSKFTKLSLVSKIGQIYFLFLQNVVMTENPHLKTFSWNQFKYNSLVQKLLWLKFHEIFNGNAQKWLPTFYICARSEWFSVRSHNLPGVTNCGKIITKDPSFRRLCPTPLDKILNSHTDTFQRRLKTFHTFV